MKIRQHSRLDQLIAGFDQALNTVAGVATGARPYPHGEVSDCVLNPAEKSAAARLMRVNHAGEVAAQALYRGHALTAHTPAVAAHMQHAATEENDHLAWCATRLEELGARSSLLNPLWYAGSFAIGALAGRFGDKWSLGFVAETEQQVVKHLDEHLARLPQGDAQSRAVLTQMRADEAQHATVAIKAGAVPLPEPVRGLMGMVSKVMIVTAYWL